MSRRRLPEWLLLLMPAFIVPLGAGYAASSFGDGAPQAASGEGAKFAFAVPPIPEWGETTNLVFPELQAAILGDKTIKEALNDAAAAVDELMRESGYY